MNLDYDGNYSYAELLELLTHEIYDNEEERTRLGLRDA